MLLFRSVAIGLLGACFLLLATHTTHVRVEREIMQVPGPRPAPAATIIDVAPGIAADQIAPLIKLDANEHIVAVDDRPVASDVAAGTALVSTASGRRFVDLTIASLGGERRVLVLMH